MHRSFMPPGKIDISGSQRLLSQGFQVLHLLLPEVPSSIAIDSKAH